MAYVPPHRTKKGSQKITPLKQFKNEFPILAPIKPIEKSKMDFSSLFNRRPAVKKRQMRMKKGWIRLTHAGIIDSLTQEERAEEDLYHTHYIMDINLEKLWCRIDNDILERMEMFPEYEPEILEFSSEEEEEITSEEESLSGVDEDEYED